MSAAETGLAGLAGAAGEPGTEKVEVYDTTLRDGSQQVGLDLTVADKLRVAVALDALGVDVVEGGWPGSNPKDAEFFARAADLPWAHAKLAAFGSTRPPRRTAEDDPNLQALLAAGTPIVTLVGKAWTLHVDEALRTTREENLAMVAESVRFMAAEGRRVIFDAEHFFDGYRADRGYALEVLAAAAEAGADTLALCDTNGGTLPDEAAAILGEVAAATDARLGVHFHNDSACAVANSVVAVAGGAPPGRGAGPPERPRWPAAPCTCRARPTATASGAGTPTCSPSSPASSSSAATSCSRLAGSRRWHPPPGRSPSSPTCRSSRGSRTSGPRRSPPRPGCTPRRSRGGRTPTRTSTRPRWATTRRCWSASWRAAATCWPRPRSSAST
jgi:hypothetical protein